MRDEPRGKAAGKSGGSENVSLCSQPRTDCHRSVDQQADEKVSGGAAEAFWSGNCIIRRSTCQDEREEREKREARPNVLLLYVSMNCIYSVIAAFISGVKKKSASDCSPRTKLNETWKCVFHWTRKQQTITIKPSNAVYCWPQYHAPAEFLTFQTQPNCLAKLQNKGFSVCLKFSVASWKCQIYKKNKTFAIYSTVLKSFLHALYPDDCYQ